MWFDVGLGGGSEAPAGTPEPQARMWQRVTSKRADVVLEVDGRFTILELRVNASSSAVGRLLQYQHLWEVQPPAVGPLSLLLVSDRVDSAVTALCARYGIAFEQA